MRRGAVQLVMLILLESPRYGYDLVRQLADAGLRGRGGHALSDPAPPRAARAPLLQLEHGRGASPQVLRALGRRASSQGRARRRLAPASRCDGRRGGGSPVMSATVKTRTDYIERLRDLLPYRDSARILEEVDGLLQDRMEAEAADGASAVEAERTGGPRPRTGRATRRGAARPAGARGPRDTPHVHAHARRHVRRPPAAGPRPHGGRQRSGGDSRAPGSPAEGPAGRRVLRRALDLADGYGGPLPGLRPARARQGTARAPRPAAARAGQSTGRRPRAHPARPCVALVLHAFRDRSSPSAPRGLAADPVPAPSSRSCRCSTSRWASSPLRQM